MPYKEKKNQINLAGVSGEECICLQNFQEQHFHED